MPSKRYKKLPEKTKDLNADVIGKLLPEVKKNCTTKFDESLDLNFQINHIHPLHSQSLLHAHRIVLFL